MTAKQFYNFHRSQFGTWEHGEIKKAWIDENVRHKVKVFLCNMYKAQYTKRNIYIEIVDIKAQNELSYIHI